MTYQPVMAELLHDFASPLSSMALLEGIDPIMDASVKKMICILEFYRNLIGKDLDYSETSKCAKDIALQYNMDSEIDIEPANSELNKLILSCVYLICKRSGNKKGTLSVKNRGEGIFISIKDESLNQSVTEAFSQDAQQENTKSGIMQYIQAKLAENKLSIKTYEDGLYIKEATISDENPSALING